jgi:hypothetical protein
MTSKLTPELLAHLGPAPFRFTPSNEQMLSAAFSLPFKIMAVALLSGLSFWAYLLHGSQMFKTDYLWLWAAWSIMAYTIGHLVMGKTRLTPNELTQTWIWEKKVALRDLAYAKLIRVPGLDWLIAPRLYVRTLMGKFTVIYACDPTMIEDFKRLSAELKSFRSM